MARWAEVEPWPGPPCGCSVALEGGLGRGTPLRRSPAKEPESQRASGQSLFRCLQTLSIFTVLPAQPFAFKGASG